MKKLYILLTAALLCAAACNEKPQPDPTPTPEENPAEAVMKELWNISVFANKNARNSAYSKIQGYADALSDKTFSSALSASDVVYKSMLKTENILCAYDFAFDRILAALKNDKPSNGESHIWFLYNMGYVVKTPSGCFGVDIYHRRAAEIAPYIDFYASTHIHQDHKSEGLIVEMQKAGKPVLTNYLEAAGNPYTSTEAKDYKIGKFEIHTFITSHNNGSTNVPVTAFQIYCGGDSGDLTLLHSGDSNFTAKEFEVTADVDVYILRYAPNALTENNVIGKVFTPKYALLSHILELSHKDPSESRWTLEQGLERASKLNCSQSFMPFWGDRMVWKNGKLE